MLLSDGLACAAVERPHEEAIAFGDRRLTWSEWHERIRRVAGALAAEGIGRGDRVAVINHNHIAVLDVILAAGTLGAATVVPNPQRMPRGEGAYRTAAGDDDGSAPNHSSEPQGQGAVSTPAPPARAREA